MGDCTPVKSKYTTRNIVTGVISLFPFIGPSFTGFYPPVSNQQSRLADLQNQLQGKQATWDGLATDAIGTNAQNIEALSKLVFGDPPGTGYVDTAIAFALEPDTERIVTISVNLFFLTILVSIIIYVISKKNG